MVPLTIFSPAAYEKAPYFRGRPTSLSVAAAGDAMMRGGNQMALYAARRMPRHVVDIERRRLRLPYRILLPANAISGPCAA
jgi:hypothetical protein